MRVTVIPIVIDALGMILKGLIKGMEELEIRGHTETIQDQPEYWGEFWRLEETCCHSDSSKRLSVNDGEENSKGIIMIIIIIIIIIIRRRRRRRRRRRNLR